MAYKIFYRVNPTTDERWKSYLCDSITDLPASGLVIGEWAVTKDTQKIYIANSTTTFVEKGAGGAATWGSITGTLSAQTDLQSALDAKETPAGAQTKVDAHKDLTTGVHGAGASTLETVAGSQAKVDARLSSANATDLTDGGATTLHSHAGGGGGINMLKKTADQTINAGAGVFADIADLTFAVVAGVDYAFHFYITFQSAATTTGWKAGVNCPAGTLDFWARSDVIANGAAGVATHTERHNTVRDDMTLLTATITQAVDLSIMIEGRYKCTANGTFAARFANELASNTQIVVQKGSWGWWF